MAQLKSYDDVLQKAWTDETFKNRFLREPKTILREIGIDIPDLIQVEVHEDEINLKNFVLPEKSQLEELEKSNWESVDPLVKTIVQKAGDDAEFKLKLLQNPKAAIEEATNNSIPDSVNICIYEDTANLKHLVLPENPDSEELSDLDLEMVAGGKGELKNGAYYPDGGSWGVSGGVSGGIVRVGVSYRW